MNERCHYFCPKCKCSSLVVEINQPSDTVYNCRCCGFKTIHLGDLLFVDEGTELVSMSNRFIWEDMSC